MSYNKKTCCQKYASDRESERTDRKSLVANERRPVESPSARRRGSSGFRGLCSVQHRADKPHLHQQRHLHIHQQHPAWRASCATRERRPLVCERGAERADSLPSPGGARRLPRHRSLLLLISHSHCIFSFHSFALFYIYCIRDVSWPIFSGPAREQ